MSDIKLKDTDLDNWELEIINGDLAITAGSEAVRQHLKQRLQTFLGEWFLDARIGVPYYEHVLVKNPDPIVLDTIFKSVILNTPGVEKLNQFDIDVESSTRTMTLIFSVETAAGRIDFSEVIGAF